MIASLKTALKSLSQARRYELLFDLTDGELAARGLSREALTRSYIAGLAHN